MCKPFSNVHIAGIIMRFLCVFFYQEIRNRHWLQVMQVTGSSFQLEANIFKLMHLLDIGLIK